MMIKKTFKFIIKLPVYFFKYCISPLIPHSCKFYPTCSSYFLQAIDQFGIFKGFYLGVKRIFKCTPFSKKYGFDPLLINIKGDCKWLF